MSVHPLIFEPILKNRIWGGRRLSELGKDLPPDDPIGESWELADLENGQSVVRSGPARGRTLGELVRDWGPRLMGDVDLFENRFPLLIKFLDARETLSVQVHPDETMARRMGGSVRVKNEAWYILDAEPDGLIYYGVKPGVDRNTFARGIQEGRTAELLQPVPVRKGDCYYLPSGTVHALGGGVMVAEIQTPSDTTYRVFDWNRVDARTGQPRELHVKEALETIHFSSEIDEQKRSHVASVWTAVTRLVTCDSFVVERVQMREGFEQELAYGGMVVWVVLEGKGEVHCPDVDQSFTFGRGDTVLLPAALKGATYRCVADSVWLEINVPPRARPADAKEGLRSAPQSHLLQVEPPGTQDGGA